MVGAQAEFIPDLVDTRAYHVYEPEVTILGISAQPVILSGLARVMSVLELDLLAMILPPVLAKLRARNLTPADGYMRIPCWSTQPVRPKRGAPPPVPTDPPTIISSNFSVYFKNAPPINGVGARRTNAAPQSRTLWVVYNSTNASKVSVVVHPTILAGWTMNFNDYELAVEWVVAVLLGHVVGSSITTVTSNPGRGAQAWARNDTGRSDNTTCAIVNRKGEEVFL